MLKGELKYDKYILTAGTGLIFYYFFTKLEMSITDAAQAISDALNLPEPLSFDISKSDGVLKKTAVNNRIIEELGNITFTPFTEAIKLTVDWFVQEASKKRQGEFTHAYIPEMDF